jgi:two-component system invasion response regulator UvrY
MNKILIADDHAILRAGLQEILVRDLQHVICDEAENAEQVLAQVRTPSWDLSTLDITMPAGAASTSFLILKACGRPPGALSMHPEDHSLNAR